MFKAPENDFLVPFNHAFRLSEAPSLVEEISDKRAYRKRLGKLIEQMDDLQRRLYAMNRYSVLLIFQAMDAAGKDSTIRAVMSGVNPAGCQVYSFKQPSAGELDHDFLWRTAKRLPQRGRIGIFNRSYYEEVLVVRVHPEYLKGQNLPREIGLDELWRERYESIREHEKHLARNGTIVLKFWLNVSQQEQHRRFISRLDDPRKNWKFSAADVTESARWEDYMQAYEQALQATSRPWAPWYSIPADDKPYMRIKVAEIIVKSLDSLQLRYPRVPQKQLEKNREMRKLLETQTRNRS